MKKIFANIALALTVFCFGNAFAQQVTYSLKDGNRQPLGQMTINYTPSGYEATMKGEKLAVEVTGTKAVATMGKLVITIPVDSDGWYHKRVGQLRARPVSTSFGDSGSARMFYVGLTPEGRLYREELWLNGKLFNRSETVIDHNDQIVWSVMSDSQGTLRLTRL